MRWPRPIGSQFDDMDAISGSHLDADDPEHVVSQSLHRVLGIPFDIHPQQRLGVRRPDIEPAVREVDGQPVD